MASYPGNPSLSAEVKNRVIGTFRQAIALYKQGRTDEAVSGCDFLLKLDPGFGPAKKLLEKARNPAAAVDVDALLTSVGDGQADPLAAARTALAKRQFERAVELAQAALATDMTNAEAQRISEEAQSKLEAQPFIQQFLEKARQQKSSGNEAAARATIEKARALDPQHPDLLDYEKAAAAAPPSFDFSAESSPFGSAFATPEPRAPSTESGPFDFSTSTATTPEPPAPEPTLTPSFDIDTPLTTPQPEPSPPSFVVEPSLPAARPASEASDFGFTFEEDQKVTGPSKPAAEPQVIPGSAGTFDFSTASVEVSAEDQTKIGRYLAEGDHAFAAGEYQKAIDLWSRIFLIDVTHEQASERIERARAKRVETDKKVEDLIAAGARAFDRGDRDGAKSKFEEALRLDPTNFAASDYLERLASGAPSPTAFEAPTTSRPADDLFAEEFTEPAEGAEILVPPPPKAVRARAAAAPAAEPRKRSFMPVALILVGVLVLGAGAWFALTKLGEGADGAGTTSTEATFTEAQSLAAGGQYDRAIAMLTAIKADDPQHERALAMIADLQKKKALSSGIIQNRPAAEVFAERLARAKQAFAAEDYITAKQAFEQAAAIQPLPPDAKAQYDMASQRVSRTQSAFVLFKEGNYRDALTALEALAQQDPDNQNVRQMISDANFNLGRGALEAEKTQEAITHFERVLAANPTDELARRSRDLAARYNNERKDLLYRIFVKYLPLRGV